MGKDIKSTKKSTESLVVTSKKVSLEMNAENSKYTNQKECRTKSKHKRQLINLPKMQQS